jgi:hypothetical protein
MSPPRPGPAMYENACPEALNALAPGSCAEGTTRGKQESWATSKKMKAVPSTRATAYNCATPSRPMA